jgi:hypothetical protein
MLAAWGTELVLITLRDLNISLPGVKWKGTGNRIPPGIPAPGDYLATFVIMAPLAFLADTSQGHLIAETLAWGFVLATLLSGINPSNPLGSSSTSTGTAPTGKTNVASAQ